MGEVSLMSPFARPITALYGATVINVSYRLAPQFKFPVAPNDIWDSLVWFSNNAQSFGADPSAGFIIGGISAGGNLAAVVAQKSLSNPLSHPFTGVWLFVPWVLESEIVPPTYKDVYFAREQNAESLLLNKKAVDGIISAYGANFKSEDFSPFNAENPHKGLPKTYIQVAGIDPLRDDGLIYERVLRENGVQTKLDVYPGVPHGHAFFLSLKSGIKSRSDSLKAVGWLLGQEAKDEDIEKLMAANPLF